MLGLEEAADIFRKYNQNYIPGYGSGPLVRNTGHKIFDFIFIFSGAYYRGTGRQPGERTSGRISHQIVSFDFR